MSKTVLLVGTRKGCFLVESDESRRDWEVRGPFCEGWPIYHAIHHAGTGAIYAAAASEWHGASVWRSPDLGETWQQSSEGLNYGDTELKLSKVSGLTAVNGRLFAGAEMPGVFESRDGGETWSLLTRSRASRAASRGTTPPTSHRGTSASRRSSRTLTIRPGTGRSCRASASSRRPTTPRRGRLATGDCARTGRSRTPRSATASTSS